MIKRTETPEQVMHWFIDEVKRLWPVAKGSFGLRKNTCIYPNCKACGSDEGHPVHTLHIGSGGRNTSIYIPKDMANTVEKAVRNGKELEKLMMTAGERFIKALKAERRRVGSVAKRKK